MNIMDAMGMMRCEDVLARLWDFLDGELAPPDDEAVKRHLELCDRCYPQYDFQRAYFEWTRAIQDRSEPTSDFRRRLFQRLLEEEAPDGSGE